MGELILDDKYVEDLIDFFKMTGHKADEKTNVLIDEIGQVIQNGIKSGVTQQSLKDYKDMLMVQKKNIMGFVGENIQLIKKFSEEIDEIDKDIY